jgi:hypothetical protein
MASARPRGMRTTHQTDVNETEVIAALVVALVRAIAGNRTAA